MAAYYSLLNQTERGLIKDWKNKSISLREIGRRLNHSHTTISRELRRNLWYGGHYYIRGAQELYEYRLKRRARRYRLKTWSLRRFVHQKLAIGWTPELIAGRLRVSGSKIREDGLRILIEVLLNALKTGYLSRYGQCKSTNVKRWVTGRVIL